MDAKDKHPIPEHAKLGLETVVAIHTRAQQATSRHHLLIERATTEIGQPRSLYVVLALTAAWVLWNGLGRAFGLPCPDPAPFAGLQCVVSVLALVLTTTILTTQNRHARISESRSHLDLQVSLLIEQKIAKLIELSEELRADMPMVRDRRDPVAEDMKQPVDASDLVFAIEETLTGEDK
jgi:uncharacterized membrane protein